jgi:hypothetical protein
MSAHSDCDKSGFLAYIFERADAPELILLRVGFSFCLILNSITPLDIVGNVELSKLVYTFAMKRDAWMKHYVPGSKNVEGLNV